MTKIDSAIKMYKRAISRGFLVDDVLMDSWFTCDSKDGLFSGIRGSMLQQRLNKQFGGIFIEILQIITALLLLKSMRNN